MATTEKANKPVSLPPYPEMIMAAIAALDDEKGSNKSSITYYIESQYRHLPLGHSILLSHHLKKMRASAQLLFVRNNYIRPDPNAPPRRVVGRPTKRKKPLLPAGDVLSPSKRRGRHPKPKDPLASAAAKVPRPRGRPRKKPKDEGETADLIASLGPRRLRERPPKVKPT